MPRLTATEAVYLKAGPANSPLQRSASGDEGLAVEQQ